MTPPLLTAALSYHEKGCPVIPVDADKRPTCETWGQWRWQAQTEPEVRRLFSRPAHGLAVLTWPASDLVVLDFDGPHAPRIWQEKTGIALPDTATNRTRSGGIHRLYRVPPETPQPTRDAAERGPQRKVRLAKDPACGCEKTCGVDLLLNGYFVVPPSPGYAEDPDAPFEPGNLAVIPDVVLALARATERQNGNGRAMVDTPGAPIAEGQRNDTLFRLGCAMRRQGASEPGILAALLQENARCIPTPLPQHEVRGIARSASRYQPTENDQPSANATSVAPGHTSTPAHTSEPEPLPAEAPETDLPPFPEVAYQGVAAEVARAYAEVIEAPLAFLYMDTLTFLGALVAPRVRLDSQLPEEPRLFTVKVGPSWSSRKSSSQDCIERFYGPILEDRLTMCYGTGSAEGLANRMKSGLPGLLIYDEFRSFVDKSSVQQSVLLPMVATLFSRTVYENATRASEIRLTDAHLSLVGACTTETFTTMFTPQFRNIGFLNRLFVVAGKRTTLKPLPEAVRFEAVKRLQDRVLAQVERAEQNKPLLSFDAEARRRWEEWYRAMPETPYAARLDTYGLRLLMLYAVTTESWKITRPLVDAVLPLLDYELAVRRELDPVDAEGVVARMERLILRHLNKGRMTATRLQDLVNVKHYGLWCFEQAMRNLRAQDWIGQVRAGRGLALWLTEAGREAANG